MKSRNLDTNAQNVPAEVPEERGKGGPSLAEIRQRAFEIHIEHGAIHGCDLDDWLEAEREIQEKYNKNV